MIIRANAPVAVVYAVLGCLAFEAGTNALFGWSSVGGVDNPIAGLFSGGIMVAVAVFGAYLVTRWLDMTGVPRALAAVIIFGAFGLAQISGWRVMGVNMADGQVLRDTKALAGGVVRDEIKQQREELARLASAPAAETVRKEIARELGQFIKKAGQTVGEATNKCAEPGWAPTACRKVRELEVRLADAERKEALTKALSGAGDKLEKAPHVAGGTPDLDMAAKALSLFKAGVTADHVRTWFPAFLVLLVSTIGMFGPALIGLRIGALDHAETMPPHSAPRAPPLLPSPTSHSNTYPHNPNSAPASFSSAPINIHVGGASVDATRPAAPGGVAVQGASPGLPRADDAAPGPEAPARLSEGELAPMALPAPERPVQRDAVKAITDQLLVFRARCLVEREGAMVLAEEVYAAYEAQAQGRAAPRAFFHAIFPTIASLHPVMIDGAVYYGGVALRQAGEPVRLQVVA